MRWKYIDISKTLAGLYYTQSAIVDLLIRAGLQPGKFDLGGSSGIVFTLMIRRLELEESVGQLVEEALKDFPKNKVLQNFTEAGEAADTYKSVYDGAPLEKDVAMNETQFEQLTDKQTTLLPISFLEKGSLMARSVARVITPYGMGSGFLISGTDLFITNNHVIKSKPVAGLYKAQFNYQTTLYGLPDQYLEFVMDDTTFYTSIDNDYTIVRLSGNPSKAQGFIPLKNITVENKSFVNIIQHPGGEFKQIALYHNLVTSVEERTVQYLTDTLPGSSGSPVFNSTWDVVALHHSGGWFPIANGSKILCNEGINVNRILADLQTQNPELYNEVLKNGSI